MSTYFVFWDRILKRVRIHKSECGACNNGAGMHRGAIKAGRGDTYDWEAAESYAAAKKIVAQLAKNGIPNRVGRSINCGLCHPDQP